MSEIELLKRQIELLEELVNVQRQTITELQGQITRHNIQRSPLFPHVSIPSVWQVDPCQHEYPNPWGGTVPPSCIKCGKQAMGYTITCTGGTSKSGWQG